MESADESEETATTVTLTTIEPVDFETYCMAAGVSQVVEVINNRESSIQSVPKPDTRGRRLVCRNGVIGYEKPDGFVVMTNFSLEVSGYVCEEGTVIGYLIKLLLSIKDDQMDESEAASARNLVREYFLTNKDMSSHSTLLNALKSDGIWTAPSKDPYLPKYVYSLCQGYMKLPKENRRKRIPVTTSGKQPNKDVWVVNNHVQLDGNGCAISPDEQVFLVVDGKIPLLPNVTTIDNGEALKELIISEKEIFANNFPQALMTIACAGLAANYELVLHDIGCCSLPVLSGAAISGKTMALRCAMAIFGQKQLLHDVTFKTVMEQLSKTTFPIGWDDADSKTVVKQVSVGTFNQGGTSNARVKLIPKTVPILTTAIDKRELRSLSRLLCIPFQPLETVFKGRDLLSRCARLNAAMDNASKSISILLSYLNRVLIAAQTSEDFDTVTDELQQFVDGAGLKVDHRALRMYSLLMFVCIKILEKVELSEEVPTIWTTMKEVVIPDFVTLPPATPDISVLLATPTASTPTSLPTTPTFSAPGMPAYNNLPQTPSMPPRILSVEETLKAFVKYVADNLNDEICTFFAPKVRPVKCSCGEVIAFNAPQSAGFIRQHIEGAHTISDASLRNFVKSSKIGCVGRCLQFHGSPRQRTSLHITRGFFSVEELKYMDDAFEKIGYDRRALTPARKKKKTSSEKPDSPETGIFIPASKC